jgi:hypothetical protein
MACPREDFRMGLRDRFQLLLKGCACVMLLVTRSRERSNSRPGNEVDTQA